MKVSYKGRHTITVYPAIKPNLNLKRNENNRELVGSSLIFKIARKVGEKNLNAGQQERGLTN